MSTYFVGTGNVGAKPEFRVFPQGNDEPRKLLKLNVRFDNPVPVKDGYQDRGGFWAPVEIWHPDAQRWSEIFQTGMRVLVQGRMVCQEWEDRKTGDKRTTFKIEARDIGILPHRVVEVVLGSKDDEQEEEEEGSEDGPVDNSE